MNTHDSRTKLLEKRKTKLPGVEKKPITTCEAKGYKIDILGSPGEKAAVSKIELFVGIHAENAIEKHEHKEALDPSIGGTGKRTRREILKELMEKTGDKLLRTKRKSEATQGFGHLKCHLGDVDLSPSTPQSKEKKASGIKKFSKKMS